MGLLLILACALPLGLHRPRLMGLSPLIALTEYAYLHSRLMAYVEARSYPSFPSAFPKQKSASGLLRTRSLYAACKNRWILISGRWS